MTEGPRVMKFGGVGLQDAAAFRKAAAIIVAEPGPKIVVASAMAGVTDAISENLPRVRVDEARAHVLLSELRRKHHDAVDGLRADAQRDTARYAVDKTMDALERLLFGICYTEEITQRSQDLALSFGERLSARILAAYVMETGTRAQAFDADKAGIVTNGRFGWASPDLETTGQNLRSLLLPTLSEVIPIITGFFGATPEGHTTIFGRGGSDFSAAIVANAVNARVLEIWKETPGFLTADPRVVSRARRIPTMAYEEAAELANFGARILHPRTVEPLVTPQIPIRVKDLKDSEAEGTLITALGRAPECKVRSVASRRGLSVLTLSGPGMGHTPGVAHDPFRALREADINVLAFVSSETALALVLERLDAERALPMMQRLIGGVIQGVTLEDGMALVAVVGKGLGERVGSAAQILGAVGAAGVNIRLASLGASPMALMFSVAEPDCEKAVRAVHGAFLED